MQAIILLGGLGTRLRGLYPDRPKALVPVAGRPFLEWQLDWLRRDGVTDIHLAAGHCADQITAWAAGRPGITVSTEPQPLGTGGALKFAEGDIRSDPFLVVNGDTLLPHLDFQGLEESLHEASKAWISLAVTHLKEAGRYGTLAFDSQQNVTAFHEKASHAAGWVNGGVYAVRRAALEELPAGRPCSLEKEAFPAWAIAGRIRAYHCPPPLLDMGTPEGLKALERYLSDM